MKTLLAIVNQANESKDFLSYVAGMAVDQSAQVMVKHVHAPINYTIGMADTTGNASLQLKKEQENLIEDSKKILKKYIEEINGEISNNIFVSYDSEIGSAILIADKIIEQNKIDGIVMEDTSNDSFWKKTSSVLDVVEKVECPVWIIPKGFIYKPYTEIVYATNYMKEDVSSLKKLINTFSHYSPKITALHITDSIAFDERIKSAGFKEMLKKQIDYELLSVETMLQDKDDDVTELLNNFALESNADLLVFVKENKSIFDQIFNTNHTKQILKNAQLPVLVYHEKV